MQVVQVVQVVQFGQKVCSPGDRVGLAQSAERRTGYLLPGPSCSTAATSLAVPPAGGLAAVDPADQLGVLVLHRHPVAAEDLQEVVALAPKRHQ